jgi:hypothetical protein
MQISYFEGPQDLALKTFNNMYCERLLATQARSTSTVLFPNTIALLDRHDRCSYTGPRDARGLRSDYAGVAELVDARGLGPRGEICGGSSPSARTKLRKNAGRIRH